MTCAQCGVEFVAGQLNCFNCGAETGEPWTPEGEFIEKVADALAERILREPTANAEYWERRKKTEAGTKRFYEARGLERAGDVTAAIMIYEELVRDGFEFFFPYERLAIIYRKSRRATDEERVVRSALAAIGASMKQEWFSARLAKLMVARGVRDLTK